MARPHPVLTTSPTSRSSNASRLRLVAALLTVPLVGACGAEPGSDEEPASVARTRQALGSPDLNPTDIWTLSDLEKLRNKPTGHYRLRANIDASATANWNGGKGWVPIPRFTGTFKGSYINGNNVETSYQITNLKIRPGSARDR